MNTNVNAAPIANTNADAGKDATKVVKQARAPKADKQAPKAPKQANGASKPKPEHLTLAQVLVTKGSRTFIPLDTRIVKLVSANPRKAGSVSYPRFEYYRTGMTVAEFLKAGGLMSDVRWDADKGSIGFRSPEAPKTARRARKQKA